MDSGATGHQLPHMSACTVPAPGILHLVFPQHSPHGRLFGRSLTSWKDKGPLPNRHFHSRERSRIPSAQGANDSERPLGQGSLRSQRFLGVTSLGVPLWGLLGHREQLVPQRPCQPPVDNPLQCAAFPSLREAFLQDGTGHLARSS